MQIGSVGMHQLSFGMEFVTGNKETTQAFLEPGKKEARDKLDRLGKDKSKEYPDRKAKVFISKSPENSTLSVIEMKIYKKNKFLGSATKADVNSINQVDFYDLYKMAIADVNDRYNKKSEKERFIEDHTDGNFITRRVRKFINKRS